MKLEKLTDEQTASLATFRENALQFALGGNDSLDVDAFHTGIDFIYSLARIDAPIKVWVDSPLGVQYAAQIIQKLPLNGEQVGAQVRAQVRAQVWAQVWDQVGAQVGDQVGAQVGDQYHQFAYCGVGYDSGWVNFYRVFTEFNLLKHDLFNQYSSFLDSGVWDTVLFQGAAIGCRRPNFVARDEENRLHNDNRSAIAWRDGFELFYLDGVHLKRDLWKQIISQEMTFDEIVAIQDADVRAVALKYNKNAIITSGAELIDDDKQFGELFLIKGKQINDLLEERELYFMRMKCPTGRTFVECVEPNTAKEILKHPHPVYSPIVRCQAAAFGVPVEIYGQLQARNEG